MYDVKMDEGSADEGRVNANMTTLVARALTLSLGRERTLIGVTGSPGAGKTTLARRLVDEITASGAATAAYVPLDGFHLANASLDRLGLRDRKGAIETFDGWGFVALLRRIRAETQHTVYAPGFDRAVDEGIAADLAVDTRSQIVVVEGNYLLAEPAPWNEIRQLLDECWFCDAPEAERFARLVDRHTRHGRSVAAAEEWATQVDGANARLIQATRDRADLIVSGLDFGMIGAPPPPE